MNGIAKYLGIATTALALTAFAAAQSTQGDTASASQLVAANAALVHALDAKTAKQGDTVTAKLTESAHIAGGTTLPRNTQLIGHVNEVQPSANKGLSKVVLTFDQARLPNGQQVAIKATIVGVYPAGTDLVLPKISEVQQVNQQASGAHGYALSSSVSDSNSGTLSANGKNVHLADLTELQFAIAPGAGASTSGN
jgi:plastocyanin